MNIFAILNNLYTNKKSDWIAGLEDTDIQPYLIQRWLCMNDRLRTHTRWLDKYVFHLTPKMYLSLAWSIIPKSEKAPFVKYITQIKSENEYDFLLQRVRHHMNLSDNDFETNKHRLINAIKADPENWFAFYGIEKKLWKKYNLDFNKMKGPEKEAETSLFSGWG